MQALALQVALATLACRVQLLPHTPQLATSVVSVLHTPPQSVCPAGQAQAPPLQALPPLHALPQVPQLVLVLSAASQPFASTLSQLPQPALQPVRVQLPVEQLAVPFARLQTVPQEPQLASVLSGVSQPTAVVQLPKPGLHV